MPYLSSRHRTSGAAKQIALKLRATRSPAQGWGGVRDSTRLPLRRLLGRRPPKGHGTGSVGPGPSFGGDTKPSKILAVVDVPPSCVEIRALWAESDAKSFDASREPQP